MPFLDSQSSLFIPSCVTKVFMTNLTTYRKKIVWKKPQNDLMFRLVWPWNQLFMIMPRFPTLCFCISILFCTLLNFLALLRLSWHHSICLTLTQKHFSLALTSWHLKMRGNEVGYTGRAKYKGTDIRIFLVPCYDRIQFLVEIWLSSCRSYFFISAFP